MATRYWVGGSGTWNGSNTTNWSASSGGAGGASVPAADDTVIFNAASSAAAYVVQVSGQSRCGQITTTAPAAGTLTFSNTVAADGALFFATSNTITPTINIHAACLFTPATGSTMVMYIDNFASTTTTVTFNGSGTNTQSVAVALVAYGGNVSFCLSQTCTFAGVTIQSNGGVAPVFTCTSSNITTNRGDFLVFGNFNTITMTGTTITTGSLATPTSNLSISIGDSSTTTWNISTLNLTLRCSSTGTIRLGGSTSNSPPTIGTVLVEGVTTTTNDVTFQIARCTTLTIRDVVANVVPMSLTDPLMAVSGAVAISSTAGATASTAFNMNYGFGNGVTFSSTFTITGQTTNYASAIITNTASLSSLSVTDGTFSPNGAITIAGATTLTRGNISTAAGSGFTLTAGDITGTGQTATAGLINFVAVDTLVSSSVTLTNTSFYAFTLATINGGVGKTFSFTVNASAPVYGDYPYIRATALTVSTPTMSIVGTATKRVVCIAPNGGPNAVWTITPTPTLQFVTFVRVRVNNGVSAYTGTSIGSDGLSVGIVAQAPRTVYCVAAGTQAFDAAIWATTPGGVGSTTNYPLPQDTIVFTTAIVGVGAITLTSASTSLYIGGITVDSSSNTVSIAPDSNPSPTGVVVNIFGNLYTSTTGITYIGRGLANQNPNVTIRASSATTRYISGMWSLSADGVGGVLSITDTGVAPSGATTYNFSSGTLYTQSLFIAAGSIDTGRPTVNTEGLTAINCADMTLTAGDINFSTTNIACNNISFDGIAPTLVIADSPYTVTMQDTGIYGNLPAGTYRGGFLTLRDSSSPGTSTFILGGASVNRLTIFSNGTVGLTRNVEFASNATVKDFTTTGATVSWTFRSTDTNLRTLTKSGGGTVRLIGNLTASYLSASPANTWYVSGTLSQINGSTGWIQGSPPSSGGFFLR